MTKTISEHWVLEYRRDDYSDDASGIDHKSRFEDKESAKKAGESIFPNQDFGWGPTGGVYDETDDEELKVHGTLIRVRKDSDIIHEDDEIPGWCMRKKRRREEL